MQGYELKDFAWGVIAPLLPNRPCGVPRVDDRRVLNGIFWVLRTGAPWADLPRRYPPYQTCHRRFQLWQRSGRLDRLLQRLAEDLRDRLDALPVRPRDREQGLRLRDVAGLHGPPSASSTSAVAKRAR